LAFLQAQTEPAARPDSLGQEPGALDGAGGSGHYLLVSPIDREIPRLKMRMDFFSPADVRTIGNFFGDKLERHGKKK